MRPWYWETRDKRQETRDKRPSENFQCLVRSGWVPWWPAARSRWLAAAGGAAGAAGSDLSVSSYFVPWSSSEISQYLSQQTPSHSLHLLLQDAVFRFDVTSCPGSETGISSVLALELMTAHTRPGGKVDVDVDEDHDAGGDVEWSEGWVQDISRLLAQLKHNTQFRQGKELGGWKSGNVVLLHETWHSLSKPLDEL